MPSQPRAIALGRASAWVLSALLAGSGMPATASAQDIVQGVLQLRWGDPPPAPAGQAPAPQFEAWLETGRGQRVPLDAVQARRAAGDLHALANRRVAVSYAGDAVSSAPAKAAAMAAAVPVIEAIVPADGRTMASAPVLGSTRWITLMCRFADVAAEQKPRAFFQAQYGDAPGQLGHFWSEVSYGLVDLAGSSAHGWYGLPRPRSAYVSVVNGRPKADLSLLFADCAAQADPEVDFDGVQGVNLMFNDELDGRAWGGGACGMLDGVHRCTRATWSPPWAFANLASLAHEMGHGYGLPHSDNSDGDSDTHDNPWDLMSDAWRHAVVDGVHGLLPKHPNMYQRERLGWVSPARRRVIPADNRQVHEFRLDAASMQGADGVQLVVLAGAAQPDPYSTVIHTIEARRRTGTYESALAGDAVIIHVLQDYGIARSIDTDVPAADLSDNEGSMLKVGEHWHTPDGLHQVEVVSATATGFVVRIGPRPRPMSSPLPARVQSAVATAPAPVSGAPRRARAPALPPAASRTCRFPPRRVTASSACAEQDR